MLDRTPIKELGEEPWPLPEELTTATAHTRNRGLFSLTPASPASHVRHIETGTTYSISLRTFTC